jgi:hypothetical protein
MLNFRKVTLVPCVAGNHPLHQRLVGDHRGVAAIVRAMTTHPSHAVIQEQSCYALTTLALKCPENKIAVQADACAGLRAVVSAMRAHEDHRRVQEEGCRALANLAFEDSVNATQIGLLGGISVIIVALRSHTNYVGVQVQGVLALFSLASNSPANCLTIRQCGGDSAVAAAMRVHEAVSIIQTFGKQGLERFASVPLARSSVVSSATAPSLATAHHPYAWLSDSDAAVRWVAAFPGRTEHAFHTLVSHLRDVNPVVEMTKQNTSWLMTSPILELSAQGLDDQDMDEMVFFLTAHPATALTTLRLAWNRIGDRGAGALAPLLSQCPALTCLDLWGNNLHAIGACVIAHAVGPSHVSTLRLSFNTTHNTASSTEVASALATLIESNTSLTSLDWSGPCAAADVFRVELALRANVELIKFSLSLGSTILDSAHVLARGDRAAFRRALIATGRLTATAATTAVLHADECAFVLPMADLTLAAQPLGRGHFGAVFEAQWGARTMCVKQFFTNDSSMLPLQINEFALINELGAATIAVMQPYCNFAERFAVNALGELFIVVRLLLFFPLHFSHLSLCASMRRKGVSWILCL